MQTPYQYADEGLEREVGVVLEVPHESFVQTVRDQIQVLADSIGCEPVYMEPPPRGFLRNGLENHQKEQMDQVLLPSYARRIIEHQRQLLSIVIEESGEPMASLREVLFARGVDALYSETPFHDACGQWAGRNRVFWLRESVCNDLAQLFSALKEIGLQPKIEDCWRHREVQKGLFIRRLIHLAHAHSDWDDETIHNVASVLTASSPGSAGHMAGAAIDWRLVDQQSSALLELGNTYPEGSAASSILFPYVTEGQWRTRALLCSVMNMGGFKVLQSEDWHGSKKDRGMSQDGRITMKKAYFGPVHELDVSTGAIIPYDQEDIDEPFLTSSEVGFFIQRGREIQNTQLSGATLSIVAEFENMREKKLRGQL